MAWIVLALVFVLLCAVILSSSHVESWDRDGRLTVHGSGSGMGDIERFHLISRWGAHH